MSVNVSGSMVSFDQYIIKYNHGGTLLREGKVSYAGGKVNEFTVDPDKICYWDLLGDVKELGYDIEKSVSMSYIDGVGALLPVCNDQSMLDLVEQLTRNGVVDVYVELSETTHGMDLPEILLPTSEFDVMRDGQNVSDGGEISDSSKEIEEGLVDVPLVEENSDEDEETTEARDKVRRYVQMEKELTEGNDGGDVEDGNEGQPSNAEEGPNMTTLGDKFVDTGKVVGHESDYLDSSDPGSYEDTSGESDADDAKRHRSKDNYFGSNSQLEDFYLDLRFKDLKSFKHELIQLSIRKGFEFEYVKNDTTRVRAKCAAKGCKWLVFCSWCSGKKVYVVKTYVAEHSCLAGTSKNRRVTGKVVANKYFDIITGMPFIKPRIIARIEKEKLKSGKWQVEWSGGAKHEVFWDNLFLHAREAYVVILDNHSCSCGKWDKTGIPCQHGLAALAFQGLDPLDYVADWFKKDTYLKAYQFLISPLRGRDFWPTSEEGPMLPPMVKKMPGRPAKKRRREPMEPKNNSRTNLSREGRVMTCSICHAKGHNKSRCARRTNSAANPQAGPQDDPQDETAPPENQCSSKRNKRTKASVAAVYCPLQTFRSHSGQMIVGRRVSHGPSFVTTSQLMELTSRRMMRQNNLDSGQQTTTSIDPTSTAMELPEFPTQASTTETEAEQRPGE